MQKRHKSLHIKPLCRFYIYNYTADKKQDVHHTMPVLFRLFLILYQTPTLDLPIGKHPAIILNTNKIQEKICAGIQYIQDCRHDFFQILNGV